MNDPRPCITFQHQRKFSDDSLSAFTENNYNVSLRGIKVYVKMSHCLENTDSHRSLFKKLGLHFIYTSVYSNAVRTYTL